ncbi:hypothetical protein [Bosea sp. BIWAKO-01]|uniref:hypothetical protein n=1 Tax=Bosea sp. BIWAKO-01 TaxID=506668 RepID=UPI00352B3D6A
MQQARPKFWKDVLDLPNMSTLRLNLAHAGGLWNFHDKGGANVWTAEVAAMLADADRRYPNLYADVGDVANFLEGTDDPETRSLVEKMRRLPRAAKARLMYGTDWTFLGRLPGARKYRASFEKVMTDVLGRDYLPGFFYQNAAAFLGLAPGAGTRRRLDAFYIDNGRQPPPTFSMRSQGRRPRPPHRHHGGALRTRRLYFPFADSRDALLLRGAWSSRSKVFEKWSGPDQAGQSRERGLWVESGDQVFARNLTLASLPQSGLR